MGGSVREKRYVWVKVPREFADRLRKARAKTRISQRSVAAFLGVSRGVIVRLEHGQEQCKGTLYVALCAMFDIPRK